MTFVAMHGADGFVAYVLNYKYCNIIYTSVT